MHSISSITDCFAALAGVNRFMGEFMGQTPPTDPWEVKSLDNCTQVLRLVNKFMAANTASLTSQEREQAAAELYERRNVVAEDYLEEFTDLRALCNSSAWPEAVPPKYLCAITSEGDKQERADGIIGTLMNRSLSQLRFLDFGCGEGHIVARSLKSRTKVSLGYDIVPFESVPWKTLPHVFTTDFKQVQSTGPYDVILVYDVLDHVSNEDPIEILKRLRDLMVPNGVMILRCHPWSSRHGAHLYHQRNRAFLHLAFSPDELQRIGMPNVTMQRIIDPQKTYNQWFAKAGLNVANEDIIKTEVEYFFRTNVFRVRLNKLWDLPVGVESPFAIMEQSFLDYVVRR